MKTVRGNLVSFDSFFLSNIPARAHRHTDTQLFYAVHSDILLHAHVWLSGPVDKCVPIRQCKEDKENWIKLNISNSEITNTVVLCHVLIFILFNFFNLSRSFFKKIFGCFTITKSVQFIFDSVLRDHSWRV